MGAPVPQSSPSDKPLVFVIDEAQAFIGGTPRRGKACVADLIDEIRRVNTDAIQCTNSTDTKEN